MAEVRCGNCGSLVRLPETSCVGVGMSISKESKGNYVLDMEDKTMTKAEERLATLKAAGIDTSKMFVLNDTTLVDMSSGTPKEVTDDPIAQKIVSNGKVFNSRLDGRHIMAEMFRMLNTEDRWSVDGYNKALRAKGYYYQWKFLLHREYSMSHGKTKLAGELVRINNRIKNGEDISAKQEFFNGYLISDMILDYSAKLQGKLYWKKPQSKDHGMAYIRLGNKYAKLTGKAKGDIYVCDLPRLEKKYRNLAYRARRYAYNYSMLISIVDEFERDMYYQLDDYNTSMCAEFISAYKGNGAYYTMTNMYDFHNIDLDIEAVKRKAEDGYKAGYKLLGMLREVLEDTGFTFGK